ncbi:hypothetical protein MFIFM68171_09934 [Madurella fahalii]|uniref:BHLH domain-containing protein n=1 Tax=Madurella fahalii TaxID=1157608 RepID=A0ABQ0GPQ2_9PEZI
MALLEHASATGGDWAALLYPSSQPPNNDGLSSANQQSPETADRRAENASVQPSPRDAVSANTGVTANHSMAVWASSPQTRTLGESLDAMAVQRTTIAPSAAGSVPLMPLPPVESGRERGWAKVRVIQIHPAATGSATGSASGSSTRKTKKASKKCLGDNNHRTLDEYQEIVRQRHNRVGKKYRDKMNGEFGQLLAALHIDDVGDDDEPHDSDGDDKAAAARVNGRSLNKAKVLDMAREYVGALLEKRGALSIERERLRRQLRLRRA